MEGAKVNYRYLTVEVEKTNVCTLSLVGGREKNCED